MPSSNMLLHWALQSYVCSVWKDKEVLKIGNQLQHKINVAEHLWVQFLFLNTLATSVFRGKRWQFFTAEREVQCGLPRAIVGSQTNTLSAPPPHI